jgi:diadenosine tetraphosphate (Ap4A) HIT family hydrolase
MQPWGHKVVEGFSRTARLSSSTAIHRFVESARRGELARSISRVRSGWVVLGDPQILRGYCLLLPDPVVSSLNHLLGEARRVFLDDMVSIGDTLLEVTGAARINYEILGNLEPALHAHIIPRYADEPEHLRTRPIWSYDWSKAPAFDLARDSALMNQIRDAIASRELCA